MAKTTEKAQKQAEALVYFLECSSSTGRSQYWFQLRQTLSGLHSGYCVIGQKKLSFELLAATFVTQTFVKATAVLNISAVAYISDLRGDSQVKLVDMVPGKECTYVASGVLNKKQ